MRTLARRYGIGARTLRDVASREVGLSPKAVLRVRRLHEAVGLGLARPGLSWARVAAATGYCDQAHLSRDFVALMGEPPQVFRNRRHVP